MNDIDSMLDKRGSRYGDFLNHASISQDLKQIMNNTPRWKQLSSDKKECLDMIAHKIARILNGDPEYHDSWCDIEGYARLISNTLERHNERV